MENEAVNSEAEVKKRANNLKDFGGKAKNWLKDPHNLALVSILIFAFTIRLYYFWLTKSQPLWWDEAEYMSAAKGYAGIIDYQLGGIRLPGFPLLMSLFFIFGLANETLMRFIALFIPSMIVIILAYILIKEMYSDKKIALISALIMSVLWEHLFYSNRFHTENFALIFEFLAIFVLFACYLRKKDFWIIKAKYCLIWIILFSVISVLFRPGNVIFIPGLILFLILINKSLIFKKKNIPILAILAILFVSAGIFIINQPKTGLLYAMHLDEPFGLNSINAFYGFYQSLIINIPPVLFYSFILGILLLIIDTYIYFPKITNMKNNEEDWALKSDLFNILIILSVMFFFIFIIRANSFEYRWFFPLLPGMLVFTSKGAVIFSEYAGSLIKSKNITLILILIIIGLGAYTQIYHADNIIKAKIDSYQQVKDSGLWMKENSNKDSIILSSSLTQHMYYSERTVYNIDAFITEENLTRFISDKKPKYFVLSAFQPHPDWAYNWPQQHSGNVSPALAYYFDSEKQQVALIVYEFK